MIHKKLKLVFVMGTSNVGRQDPLLVLEEALKGGVTCFQLRERGTEALVGSELKAFAERCKELCQAYGVLFIVNGDVELAIDIGADGVHIDHVDRDIVAVRDKIGPDMLLGVSTHNVREACAAADAGANYIGVGPVYGEKTKTDTRSVVGPGTVREIATLLPGMPIVGVGGISERKIWDVIKAGASGVAVISITGEGFPEEAARRLKGRVLLSLTGVEM